MGKGNLARVLIVRRRADSALFLNFTNFASIIRRGTSWRGMRGFPFPVDCNQILVRPPTPHRRDARVFISGLDLRQIGSSQTLVVNNHPKIDNTFIRHPWMTIQTNVRPFFFSPFFLQFTFFFTLSVHNDTKCDWKRMIKCDAMRYSACNTDANKRGCLHSSKKKWWMNNCKKTLTAYFKMFTFTSHLSDHLTWRQKASLH